MEGVYGQPPEFKSNKGRKPRKVSDTKSFRKGLEQLKQNLNKKC